jgi:hypothetical protein
MLLRELPSIILPNITIKLDAASKELGLISQSLVDLDVVLNSSLENKDVFLTVSEKLLNTLQAIETTSADAKDITQIALLFVNPVLSILALCLAVYLFFKQRKILSALSLFGMQRPANALPTLPKRIWVPDFWKQRAAVVAAETDSLSVTLSPSLLNKISLPELQKIDVSETNFRSNITTILVLLLTLLIISWFVKILRRCFSLISRCYKLHSNHQPVVSGSDGKFFFSIYLVIGGENNQIFLELLSIPYNVDHYVFTASRFIQDVKLTGTFRPKLTYSWPNFSIANKFAPLQFTLPNSVNLSRAQAKQIQALLAKPHHILLFTKSPNDNFTLLPLQNSLWENQAKHTLPPPVATQAILAPSLYPTLRGATKL